MAKGSKSISQTDIAHSERAHSDVVGGSSADVRLNCPASYKYEQMVPASVRNKSSSYAEEGTALHEAMEYILTNDVEDMRSLLGMEFNGYVMDRALINDGVIPALDYFDDIADAYEEEGGLEFLQEKLCQMPGIPNAFGTTDVIGRTDKRTVILDWKFGAGVAVKAEYPPEREGGKPRPNSQLMFYARAAAHTHPEMFGVNEQGKIPADWPIDLIIIQPRVRTGQQVTRTTVTYAQLEAFRMALVRAVAEAQSANPTAKEGPWCTFRACQSNCPLKLGPLLDLSKIGKDGAKRQPGDSVSDWSERYAMLLDLAARAEPVIRAIQGQAHAFLEEGNSIVDENGEQAYKLVPKRASDTYTDKDGAAALAKKYGLDEADIYTEPEVRSVAQIRDALAGKLNEPTKKARVEKAKELLSPFYESVSSGTTLAPADDARLDVTPTATQLANLAKKLGLASK